MGKRRYATINGAQASNEKANQSLGKSDYAQKVRSGRQMYGGRGSESCCAHRMKSMILGG